MRNAHDCHDLLCSLKQSTATFLLYDGVHESALEVPLRYYDVSILVSLLTVVTVLSTVPVMASSTLADSLLAPRCYYGIAVTGLERADRGCWRRAAEDRRFPGPARRWEGWGRRHCSGSTCPTRCPWVAFAHQFRAPRFSCRVRPEMGVQHVFMVPNWDSWNDAPRGCPVTVTICSGRYWSARRSIGAPYRRQLLQPKVAIRRVCFGPEPLYCSPSHQQAGDEPIFFRTQSAIS